LLIFIKMKNPIQEKIQIPEGISCSYINKILTCTKDSTIMERKISLPGTEIKINNNEISLNCKKGNKRNYKTIKSNIAHIKNMFSGLQEKFVYKLESCNVHFPMTLKVEGTYLVISNFLGEKVPRHAKILPNVEVEIKGQKIEVSSYEKEAAGQTAANLEKSTKIKSKDKRIYQDGIYIVEKPLRKTQ